MRQPTSTSEFSETESETKKKITTHTAPITNKVDQNFIQRTRWTVFMLLMAVIIIGAGQIYSSLFVLVMNILVFKEVSSIKRNAEKEAEVPMTKYINWYIYGLVNYYALGVTITNRFTWVAFQHPILHLLLSHHNFITFCGLLVGFVGFVLSLKHGYLRYQFRLFAWMLIASVMVCLQSWLGIQTILKYGAFWFVVPALLIVCNDIFAYLVGYFFGKTKLIDLSPKKTWEGFIGGGIFTILFSFILTSTMSTIPGFMCGMEIPTIVPFSYPQCNSSALNPILGAQFLPFELTTAHLHILVMSIFASTIGPFGGFFASGLKRAMKIKDFSDLIPGHGGVSDRMDCQMVMCSFVFLYLNSFLGEGTLSFGILLSQLTYQQKKELFKELKLLFSKNDL